MALIGKACIQLYTQCSLQFDAMNIASACHSKRGFAIQSVPQSRLCHTGGLVYAWLCYLGDGRSNGAYI